MVLLDRRRNFLFFVPTVCCLSQAVSEMWRVKKNSVARMHSILRHAVKKLVYKCVVDNSRQARPSCNVVYRESVVKQATYRVARFPPTKYGRFLSISSSMQPMLTRQGTPTPTVYCTYIIKHRGPKSVLFRQNRWILICLHCSIYNEWNNHI